MFRSEFLTPEIVINTFKIMRQSHNNCETRIGTVFLGLTATDMILEALIEAGIPNDPTHLHDIVMYDLPVITAIYMAARGYYTTLAPLDDMSDDGVSRVWYARIVQQ